MKTEIERIALTLPAGFADRAPAIARLLGQALAEQAQSDAFGVHGAPDARHERLTPDCVRVDAHASDAMIAGSIARAIAAALRSHVTDPAGSPENASCSRR
jgi:hypothetical protein